MSTIEMLLRLGAGIGLGTVIGFERQYRARMAGLRTDALVAVGATLFVLLSANGFSGATADPTRVAAQIVSGIGFLGAGVILRDGLNLRGLNTAATLWCSAAVGAFAGSGFLGEHLIVKETQRGYFGVDLCGDVFGGTVQRPRIECRINEAGEGLGEEPVFPGRGVVL